MDFFTQVGELALGSRLKRLSDQVMGEGRVVYANAGIDFEPRWFPVFSLLEMQQGLSVTEIASHLGISHPAVVQAVNELEKKGWIKSSKDQSDGRRRILQLTKEAKLQLPKMKALWQDIANAIHKTLQEHNHNLLDAIQNMEHSLNQTGFADRVKSETRQRQMEEVEIIEYDPQFAEDFKRINYLWIEKYFKVEQIDRDILEDHQEIILGSGGHIFFAKYQGQIAGTCAIIKHGDDFELSKMGVLEGFKGKQIGKKLCLAAIQKAKELGAPKIYLESNKKLTPAINLYRSTGFQRVNGQEDESDYQRCDIYMEIVLDHWTPPQW